MRINLNDWLGHHTWAWWFMVALVCAGAEVVRRTPMSRILALGALSAAATAVVFPRTQWLQAAVGLLVVGGLVLVGRSNLGNRLGLTANRHVNSHPNDRRINMGDPGG